MSISVEMKDASSSAAIIKSMYENPAKQYEEQLSHHLTKLTAMGHDYLDEVLAASMWKVTWGVPKRQALYSDNEYRAEPS